MWDWVVYLKGLCITSLIVPLKLSSSNLTPPLSFFNNKIINSKEEKKIREGGQIEVRRLTTSSSELENNNNGPHEVSSKDKPSINLGFIE